MEGSHRFGRPLNAYLFDGADKIIIDENQVIISTPDFIESVKDKLDELNKNH